MGMKSGVRHSFDELEVYRVSSPKYAQLLNAWVI